MKNIDESLKELKKAYAQLNKYLFNNELIEPVFLVQSSRRAKNNFLGWCTRSREWLNKDTGQKYYEITIAAEHLNSPVEDILQVLVHELVHLYCNIKKIKDVGSGQYHNKLFKKYAEKFLLQTNEVPNKRYGYGYTTPTDKLLQLFKDLTIDRNAFSIALENTKAQRTQSVMNTYVCNDCNAKFRTILVLSKIVCNCGGLFEMQTKE
jgi:hypothetical protein